MGLRFVNIDHDTPLLPPPKLFAIIKSVLGTG
jgi:hypothetical protein